MLGEDFDIRWFDESKGNRKWGRWMTRSTRFFYLISWGLFWCGIACFSLLLILLFFDWGYFRVVWIFPGYLGSWLLFNLFSVIMEDRRSFHPLMVHTGGLSLQPTFLERRKGSSSFIRRSEIESVRLVRRRALWGRMVRSSGSRNHLVDSHAPNELLITLTTGQVRRTGKRKPTTIRAAADIIEEEWGVDVVDDEGDR